MPDDRLKKITKESYDAIINHDIDKFATFLADNAVDYGQGPEPVKGKAAIIEGLKSFLSAFPDYKVTVEDIAVSGNRVYIKNNFKATHTMPLMGMIPATGKKVDWHDTDIIEFDSNGKISAHWANNPNEPLYQIGYGSFTNPNTAIILDAYNKFGKQDFAGIAALCANNVVWDVSDNPSSQTAKVYNGQKEVTQFFANLMANAQVVKFEPQRFLADGDDVMTMVDVEYKLKGDPKTYSAPFFHAAKCQNGKIVSFKEVVGKSKEAMMAMAAKK